MRVLIISANHFEDTELLVPFYRLKEAGSAVDIASIRRGEIEGKHGYKVEASRSVDEVSSRDYDVLVIPGGKAPGKLRKNERVLELTREFVAAGKTVAAICHGPQVLVSANVVKGRKMTCAQGVAAELKEAGAAYEHQAVVVDGNLITSREPGDLPFFNRAIVEQAASGARRAAA